MPEERPPARSTKNRIVTAGARHDWPSPEQETNAPRQRVPCQRQSRPDGMEGAFQKGLQAQTERLRRGPEQWPSRCTSQQAGDRPSLSSRGIPFFYGNRPTIFHKPAQLIEQLGLILSVFGHDLSNAAVEFEMIFGTELPGRHHDHRDLAPSQ